MTNTPTRYRKKPVVIEAIRWDGTAAGATEIIDWVLGSGGTATYRCDGVNGCPGTEEAHYVVTSTLEGDMLANPGDWIIKEPFPTEDRTFYPCKPEIFEATYEPAGESA